MLHEGSHCALILNYRPKPSLLLKRSYLKVLPSDMLLYGHIRLVDITIWYQRGFRLMP